MINISQEDLHGLARVTRWEPRDLYFLAHVPGWDLYLIDTDPVRIVSHTGND